VTRQRAPGGRLQRALRVLLVQRYEVFREELTRAAAGVAAKRVHQSRVAARTLRSVIGTLDGALEPQLATRARRDLRGAAHELGAVREADVRKTWLLAEARRAGLPPDALHHLQLLLDRDRLQARRRFRQHARSLAFRERCERLDAVFAQPRLVARCADLEGLLRRRLQRRWKRLVRALRAPHLDARELHDIRLCAKHARYATEALLPLLGADPQAHLKPLRRLQSCLGEHQDAADALRWLAGLDDPQGAALLAQLRRPVRQVMRHRAGQLGKLGKRLRMPPLDLQRET
jgi:CHAD domain-containing protein